MLKSEQDKQQVFNVIIKRGLFDRVPRQLLITPDFISFQNKNEYTKFNKEEIKEYRFGINWIKGLEFTIGREFLFFIRTSSKEVLKINFKTFYNINKDSSYKLSNDILNALWEFHFGSIANQILNNVINGQKTTIGKTTLLNKTIIVKENGLFKDDIKTFTWDNLELKDYHSYFVIYSSSNPSKLNATFHYLSDWNTGVLYSIIATIIKNRNFEHI